MRALIVICCYMPGRRSNGEAPRKVHSRVRHFGEVGAPPVGKHLVIELLSCVSRLRCPLIFAHTLPCSATGYKISLLSERTGGVGMISARNFLRLRRAMSLRRSWRASRAPAHFLDAVVVAAVAAVAGAQRRVSPPALEHELAVRASSSSPARLVS